MKKLGIYTEVRSGRQPFSKIGVPAAIKLHEAF
jgi:hypothetical protein